MTKRESETQRPRLPHRLASLVSLMFMAGLSLFACSQGAPTESKPAFEAADLATDSAAPDPDSPRKLAHNAELSLEVENYADARAALETQLASVKGFVKNAKVRHANGRVSSARLVLGVPSAALQPTLQACAELGVVRHESLSSKDVTEAHLDLSARLANARRLESRLLDILKTDTSELTDLLELERELARVREGIELLDGNLKTLNQRVAFSTLTLELKTRDTYIAAARQPLGDEVTRAFAGSLSLLVEFGRGLLVVLVALIPWIVVASLPIWIILRLARLRTRRALRTAPIRS